jgi:carboxyl-terminal processing protease
MRFRTGLLLGVAFGTGVALAPAAGLLSRMIGGPAVAQEGGRAETYRLLDLFGGIFERVRAEYVEPVNDRDVIENAINGMLTGLDPHSSYLNPRTFRDMQTQTRGEFGGLGIEVTQENGFIKVISPIDDTPAFRAGIRAGDLIVALDGQSTQGLTLNEAVDRMRGAPRSEIRLTIRRPGVERLIELSLVRDVIRIQVVRFRQEGDVGYIRVSSFNEQTEAAMRRAMESLRRANPGLRGLVLDLRNNPGGLLDQAVSVADDFLEQGEIVSTRARRPEDAQRWNARAGDITGGLPIVVLVNVGSASASEIVAGALQDHRRAIVMGQRSFGKGSVQTVMPIPGNGAIRLTTARYYTPSGRSIQGLGITPDIEVLPTREEATSGPQRESDLRGSLRNDNGDRRAAQPAPPRTDMPAMVRDVPRVPPASFPAFDLANPATDFQLQQALAVVRAMASSRRSSTN